MESKIIIIVEGAKTDFRLMEHLLDVYGISNRHEIVSFNTNIYTLYNEMFVGGEPETMDVLQVLKEREHDPQKRRLLDENYSDILLVFDFEPQADDFSAEKISEMLDYFAESSDMGKLYINYPMVEAFYHMKSIPDEEYSNRTVDYDDVWNYKTIVNRECRNGDYKKFAINKAECDIVIRQNIDKGKSVSGDTEGVLPSSTKVLQNELQLLDRENKISVLCTCAYYIAEYNPGLIE